MVHDDVQNAPLLFHVFDEGHPPSAHGAFGAHAVAASHLRVLVDKLVPPAEGDAHPVVPFEHLQLAAFGSRMQVDDAVFVAEVHGDDVRISFRIGDAYMAYGRLADDGLDPLLFFYRKSPHFSISSKSNCFFSRLARATRTVIASPKL